MMNGPTWAQIGNNRRSIESRDVVVNVDRFNCPFCQAVSLSRMLKKVTGHRCNCGALFSTSRAEAHHFKGRDE